MNGDIFLDTAQDGGRVCFEFKFFGTIPGSSGDVLQDGWLLVGSTFI